MRDLIRVGLQPKSQMTPLLSMQAFLFAACMRMSPDLGNERLCSSLAPPPAPRVNDVSGIDSSINCFDSETRFWRVGEDKIEIDNS
jgi:hypothetical protein